MSILIFDTSVCSSNLGDFIIMDSVREQLDIIFPKAMKLNTYTHEKISKPSYRLVTEADYKFVGGTNLLSSEMNNYNQWKINLFDSFKLNNILLLGVGWWQYQDSPNLYTRFLLKSILNDEVLHSVRDSYTKRMLNAIGLKNVVNTACPTMWNLTETHCRSIPNEKASNVVFTLTDYNKVISLDSELITILKNNYKNVHFWPQGKSDLEYLQSFNEDERINIIPPTLSAYNSLLANNNVSVDYIGTRLHAGIRALQHKRRSIIIGIDNRAKEKHRDFNIPICSRENLDDLDKMINSDFQTEIRIPLEQINKWKSQFK